MILITGAHGHLGQAVGRLLGREGRAWKSAPRDLHVFDLRGVNVLIECAAGMTLTRMRERVFEKGRRLWPEVYRNWQAQTPLRTITPTEGRIWPAWVEPQG